MNSTSYPWPWPSVPSQRHTAVLACNWRLHLELYLQAPASSHNVCEEAAERCPEGTPYKLDISSDVRNGTIQAVLCHTMLYCTALYRKHQGTNWQ